MNNQALFARAKSTYDVLLETEAQLKDELDELGARLGMKPAEVKTLIKASNIAHISSKATMQLHLWDRPEDAHHMKAVK